jgi:hypothetical protein
MCYLPAVKNLDWFDLDAKTLVGSIYIGITCTLFDSNHLILNNVKDKKIQIIGNVNVIG